MSELIEATAQLPAELQAVFNPDELAGDLYEGVSGGFAVVSIRGAKWRIKHGGEESLVTKTVDGEEMPVPTLEVVLVKASRNVSKIYYESQYSEGDDSPPTCFSIDGQRPDPSAENPQSETCATCPHNAWGSRITESGKKAKACSDSRRVVIVPLGDILNEQYNGPMLLRVPAASLADLAAYGKGMAAKGFPYNAIGTRIGFDDSTAYPKLTFKPIRKLTAEELRMVAEVAQSDKIQAILETASDVVPAKPAEPAPPPKQEAVSLDFKDDEPAPAPKKVAKKKVAKKKVAKKAEPPAEASAQAEDDLDAILSDLDSLA